MNIHSIQALLQTATQTLTAHSDSPRLDAQILLCHCLNCSRTWLIAWPERVPDHAQQECFKTAVLRRVRGEPIAHITGQREFWSLPLHITADTLVPRPETELLVELALTHIDSNTATQVVDLGTGSGAIALAIASERPRAHLIATDRSAKALAVAEKNAQVLQLEHITFLLTHWCADLPRNHFDVMVSNPPYIPSADPHLQQGDVRFEPVAALVSGSDGLDDLRDIIQQTMACLKPTGWLLVEHGYDQGPAVLQLFREAGFIHCRDHLDLAGQSRVSAGQRPEK